MKLRVLSAALLLGSSLLLTAPASADPFTTYQTIKAAATTLNAADRLLVATYNKVKNHMFPPECTGLCAVSTPTYVAVLDNEHQYHVFALPQGFITPNGVTAGRKIRVNYQRQANGLLEVSKIQLVQ
jgi:hypothetical protein